MPRVTITRIEGRTLDQKRARVKGFVDVCVDVLGIPAERCTVAITEYGPENLAPGGVLWCDKEVKPKI